MLDLKLLRKEKIELRDYQVRAAENALARGNTLVVMPTALGKTFIALLAIAHSLAQPQNAAKKALFMTPTKPLAVQQAQRSREVLELPEEEIIVVTGEMPPAKRRKAYEQARVVCATPQTIENDLAAARLDLRDFAIAVFDEAHRAVGEYAYSAIGRQAKQTLGLLVIGLTASPGAKREKIEEVCEALGIKNIELLRAEDEEARRYAKPVDVEWVFVDIPPQFAAVRRILDEMLDEEARKLEEKELLPRRMRENKRFLLELQQKLQAKIPYSYRELSIVAKMINLNHAIELLESQGVRTLKLFLESLGKREKKSRAVLSLLADARTAEIISKCDSIIASGLDHPKVFELKRIVGAAARAGQSVIVFAHYRASVKKLLEELNALRDVQAKSIVGRAGEGGMKQEEQKALLQDFREKKFNVLVGTSIAEEGVDLPSVDLVVFYEAVPSEIRLIQRRGRAGRIKAGKAVILVARGTKDEAYLWSAKKREEKMHRTLSHLSAKLETKKEPTKAKTKPKAKPEGQTTIGDFT
ncbi:MAG: helicase-related protein [Candidatus Norongarragalinales archaeon]